jgi:hypothetical protein
MSGNTSIIHPHAQIKTLQSFRDFARARFRGEVNLIAWDRPPLTEDFNELSRCMVEHFQIGNEEAIYFDARNNGESYSDKITSVLPIAELTEFQKTLGTGKAGQALSRVLGDMDLFLALSPKKLLLRLLAENHGTKAPDRHIDVPHRLLCNYTDPRTVLVLNGVPYRFPLTIPWKQAGCASRPNIKPVYHEAEFSAAPRLLAVADLSKYKNPAV